MSNNSSSVSADCYSFDYLCAADFEADADIGGWGVASAFIATAFITISAAALNAVFPAQCAWYRFLHWRHKNYAPAPTPPQGLPHELWPRSYSIYQVTYQALDALGKLQLTTGTAILITGFVDFANTSFYHRQLIMSYWQLTLNSYWAAHGLKYSFDRNKQSFRFESPAARTSMFQWDWWSRKTLEVGIFANLTMAAVFGVMTYRAEDIFWDACQSGHCYLYYSTDRSGYTWVVGYVVFAVFLFFDIIGIRFSGQQFCQHLRIITRHTFSAEHRSPAEWVNWALNRINHWLGVRSYENWREAKEQPSNPLLSPMAQAFATSLAALLALTAALALSITWSATQFLAVWSAGSGFHSTEVLVYIAFAIWNTTWIVDLKRSNMDLLSEVESVHGFGQILPLLLLFMVLLTFVEAARDVINPPKQNP